MLLGGCSSQKWKIIHSHCKKSCVILLNRKEKGRGKYVSLMWKNKGLQRSGESQAGIKIARRNIKNLRYALMTESKEELNSLLMRVKEESGKAGLKHKIQKTKIIASSPITSWQIDR